MLSAQSEIKTGYEEINIEDEEFSEMQEELKESSSDRTARLRATRDALYQKQLQLNHNGRLDDDLIEQPVSFNDDFKK